jgi:polygalacturonase/sugar lactone lactonase YvrE
MHFVAPVTKAVLIASLFVVLDSPFLLAQAPAVATGDTRTVVEPTFPATCQTLNAGFHDVNEDIPGSVEAVSTNPDQARLQAALNACTGTSRAVELSMDSSGNNAFLTGPIVIPTGVTLLVDPGVTLYFSRNAQDYDKVQGVHTCGTVSAASNTSSCQNLITISNANNSGVMGYGKLNGRGGDVVLNSFPTAGYEASTAGKSWWDLATDANADGGNQQNPRGIQISNSTNITLYKITYKNPPNFHVSMNGINGFTAWDIKIVTPYNARNTDGIDPGNATNVTIKNSWISDGDDNVAVGAPSSLSSNISVVNNHFYAGHGESIGSFTNGGVNNVLFDSNAMYGDAEVDGSNSTGIRIKSANDRGGVVQNIQYSNSCFVNHGTQIQFNPVYNTNTGTLTPNFKNILLQNLRFSNQGAVATGSVQFTGANNNGTLNPLVVTLDNVTIDTLSGSNLVTPTNANITLGPGQVSSNLTSLLLANNGINGNSIIDNRAATGLVPPACNFTFLAPELTGPSGGNQTVTAGQFPTAVVILTPTFSSIKYPYPTGTVTLTDESNNTFTASLSGTGDTVFVPITNAPAGTHTYTASYSGNSVYSAIANVGNYTVTVNPGSLPATSIGLTGIPGTSTYGVGFTAFATVFGSGTPSGSVSFLVNGASYATAPLASGTASYAFNLPVGTYSISAVYNGDNANGGSLSSVASVAIGGAQTATTLTSTSTTATVGTPVSLTATVTSPAGTPPGSVSFNYTSSTHPNPTLIGNAPLTNGTAVFSALLPEGTDNVTATYVASGNFGSSTSSPAITITVNAAPPVPVSAAPVALPYTMSTIVGGGASLTCSGSDKFGNGCLGTAIQLSSGDDLRGVAVDPFGNVYFTDATATLVRKVSTNGIVTNFAGLVSGTACTPAGATGCTPTLVKLKAPRGVFSDSLGNIFIAGYNDNKVYEVKIADGKMYVIAGTGSAPSPSTAPAGDGGPATNALFNGPRSVATDPVGNIYIADSGDNRIREILNPNSGLPGAGNIQTIAGNGTTNGAVGDGGLATVATLNNPQGVLTDSSGNVYIAESARVRALCVNCTPGTGLYSLLNNLGVASPINGDIYTIAGTGTSGNSTLKPGLGNTVNMAPQKIYMDADNNLYITDSSNNVVWFQDSRSGYARVIAGGGTTTSCGGSPIGDGCAGTQATIGSAQGNGIGLTLDGQGNLYISDSTNLRIRKVSNNLQFATSAVATPVAQPIQLHFIPGDSPTGTSISSTDFTLGAGSCTTNPDNSNDCGYTATFNPAVAGPRSAPLTVNTALSNQAYLGFTGTGQGAGATLDPAAQFAFGQNLSINAIATDNAGNVYVADATSKSVLKFSPGAGGIGAGVSAPYSTLGTFTNPTALAVDSLGNVYVADATTGLITQISPAGASKTLGTGFTSPQGLAVDTLNNLYVSDATAKTITQVGSNFFATRVIANTNLASPAGLAVDGKMNVYVADSSANSVFKYTSPGYTQSIVTSAASAPRSVAVDAAGNVLVGDSASGAILAVPASTNSGIFTAASGLPANTIALDSIGNLYTASSSNQALELERTQGLTAFSRINNAPVTVNLLSTGSVSASLSLTDADQTNFGLSLASSTDCSQSTTISVVPGGACQFTSQFTPTSNTTFSNTATFTGNAANAALASPATLEIVQTGDNSPFPDTVTLGSFSPTTPTFGQSVTLTATVTSVDGTPTGTITFSIDGNNLAPVTVSNGSASATATSLAVGNHPVTATFTSNDGSFANNTSSTSTVTVAQATATGLLSIQSATPVYGTPNSVTVSLSSTVGTPTGTVQFTIDGAASGSPVAVMSGIAQFTLPTLTAGQHMIAAMYSGDTDFSPANIIAITITVLKATPVISWATPAPILYGVPLSAMQLNATANVAGTFAYAPPIGTVLLPGVQPLSATFTPTDSNDYNAAGASVMLTVASPVVSFTVSSTQQVYPTWTNFVISPENTGKVPTGTVTILDVTPNGNTALVTLTLGGDGKAYWTTNPPLNAGSHTIIASYSGDSNYPAGISLPTMVTVTPAAVKMGVSCWGGTPYGVSYTCQANLSSSAGSPTGSINYALDGGSPVAVPISKGSAQFVISQLSAGSHQVVISYGGQSNYAAASPQTVTFTTQPGQTQVQLSPSSYYLQSGSSLTLTAAVSSPQSGIPAGSVTFFDSGTPIGTTSTANGIATLVISHIAKGQHGFTAVFGGNPNFSGATSGASTVTAY